VNVYLIESDSGLTLIDGGWATEAARHVLERSIRSAGYDLRDIRQLFVTHVHGDHYTMARILADELGVTSRSDQVSDPPLMY
jgi:glyoxylase-like metal-dependent hydrolase (beta-lactamase superfamily II)